MARRTLTPAPLPVPGSAPCAPVASSAAAWCGIAALAVLGGVLRERRLVPRHGEARAHQVSTAMLVTVIFWAASTDAFEVGLGRPRPFGPHALVADHHVRAGRLWALAPGSPRRSPR